MTIKSKLYRVCVLEEDPGGPAGRVRVVEAGGVGGGRGGRAGGHGCYNRQSHSLHPCLCFSPGDKAETDETFLLFFTRLLQSKQ